MTIHHFCYFLTHSLLLLFPHASITSVISSRIHYFGCSQIRDQLETQLGKPVKGEMKKKCKEYMRDIVSDLAHKGESEGAAAGDQ